MGCQYKIANQIVEAGGDYLFSLKGNQETLCDDVEEYFNIKAEYSQTAQETDVVR
jgi:predicted transposase YbfD/YdcC